MQRTVDELGGIDIVVNNAGGSVSRPLLDTTVADLEHSFHFNISSPFELVRLAVPHMLERGGGAIVNIGSVAGAQRAPRVVHPQPHQGRGLADDPAHGRRALAEDPRQRRAPGRDRDRVVHDVDVEPDDLRRR